MSKASCFADLIETYMQFVSQLYLYVALTPWKAFLYLRLFITPTAVGPSLEEEVEGGRGHPILDQPCVAPLSSITISTSPWYLGLTAS
jgi:hypothetical protein